MRLFKDALYQLPGEGYLTMQIPTLSVSFPGEEIPDPVYIDVPDEWFFLKNFNRGKGTLAIGKESGCLYWSPKGYQANKEQIKAVFEQAVSEGRNHANGSSWAAFEEFANEFFAQVKKDSKHYLKQLEAKTKELRSKISNTFP